VSTIVVNSGLILILQWAFGATTGEEEDFVLDLFSNNHTVAFTDTSAAYTVATFPGYAQVSVPRSSFGTPTASGGTGQVVSTVDATYTCTGGTGQLCYGAYLRGAVSGTLIAAGNFNNARNMLPSTTEDLGLVTILIGQYP
jgi:hypothetical protein